MGCVKSKSKKIEKEQLLLYFSFPFNFSFCECLVFHCTQHNKPFFLKKKKKAMRVGDRDGGGVCHRDSLQYSIVFFIFSTPTIMF